MSSSPGEKPGTPQIVQVLPSHYIAQTNSAIIIRAKILNGNGMPLRNEPVTFTNISPIGTLINMKDIPIGSKTVIKTNDNGMATLKVKSTTTGFVTIQAEVARGVGIVRDRKTVFFTSSLSASPFMYLDADGDNDGIYNEPDDYTLFQNNNANDNQVLFRATVFDKFGQRVFGSTVLFSADFPYKVGTDTTCSDGTTSCSVTFPNGNSATTNSSGEAFVLVQVDPTLHNITTVLNILAVADNGAANVYSLFLEPITITEVTVTANPAVVAPDGESTISASVRLNTGGQPPDGTAVGFVASCGTVDPFALTTSGLATATFTAPSVVPSPPVCTVTATVAGVSNHADITISSALNVQPATQSINGLLGGTVSYVISGGVAPYTVTSSNRFAACNDGNADGDCSDPEDSGIWNITTADASGAYIFTVTVPINTAAQGITLSVRDSTAQTKDATLSIGSGGALSVMPPTSTPVSINGATGGTVTFTIFGGVPPYDIFSNSVDTALAPNPDHVTASGGTFVVTVPAAPAGTPARTIIYTVRDSVGTTTTGTVNITATAALVAPVANFVGTPLSGVAPLAVTFADLSTGSPTAWSWSFGDGGTSTSQNPSHTYNNAGTYTVTLTVTAAGGTDSETKTGYITVTAPPVALSISGTITAISENALPQTLLFSVAGGTPGYTIASSNANLAFNDNGGGTPANANNGVRDPGEGGIWTLAAAGPVIVTVPAGDIIPALGTSPVTLTVVDASADSDSVNITIQNTLP